MSCSAFKTIHGSTLKGFAIVVLLFLIARRLRLRDAGPIIARQEIAAEPEFAVFGDDFEIPDPKLLSRQYTVPSHQAFYPINFAIPEFRIVKEINETKTNSFSAILPGVCGTYKFPRTTAGEAAYYADMAASYFAVTKRKHGWDCMRHYEILASGAVPFFINIENSPAFTMFHLPKKVLIAARKIRGVQALEGEYPPDLSPEALRTLFTINHTDFDKRSYFNLARALLRYTRKHLTTTAQARYVLQQSGNAHANSALLIGPVEGNTQFDYMEQSIIDGFRNLLGARAVEYPKSLFLYRGDTPADDDAKRRGAWGGGMTLSFTQPKEDPALDRDPERLQQMIRDKAFDVIIYSRFHHMEPDQTIPWFKLVTSVYNRSQVLFIDGADHNPPANRSVPIFKFGKRGTIFRREDARPAAHTEYNSKIC